MTPQTRAAGVCSGVAVRNSGPLDDLAPAARIHEGPLLVAHFHVTREERRACEAEHATIRARWDALNRPQE